ncbi:MAG: asparagine synthase (glutamine-hydrolyzing) [Myxococcota bacterium]|nr:asparagine synthase (glutamine-hydrolyzing) [Myxococcota bacterium]
MCGFTGILDADRATDADTLRGCLSRMADTLAHRGPDDRGTWVDPQAGVGLGHRRLAILDPGPDGAQPMVSRCGRYVVVYNGELYDFRELRRELEKAGHGFRGHSDTEVLVEGISAWGVEETVRRSNGMFAFALWDRAARSLTLARDRIGKKPVYYGWCGRRFLFGSELRALRAHPDFRGEVDRDALGLLVRYSYVPAPRSIFRGIRKLEAGHLATLSAEAGVSEPTLHEYWSRREVAAAGLTEPFTGTPEDAEEELDGLLRDAVARRMVADVELGALLSGGFDSSTVVAMMQAQSERPVRTFSIGFLEEAYDESHHARAIAKHLGTDHREITVTPRDALASIPELPAVFDEPFADMSQIPTLLVSRLAREDVTVALSGDGGDELFAGYSRYHHSLTRWRHYARLPTALRRALAPGLSALARASSPRPGRGDGTVGTWRRRLGSLDRELELVGAGSPVDVFMRKVARCPRASRFVTGAGDDACRFDAHEGAPGFPDAVSHMMYLDFCSYLQEDVLTKVDRASMAASLEVRCPILDHRVVELAWRLPFSMKVADGQSKWILRRVLDRYLPRELTDRPKQGFGIPMERWLAGPLRDWADALLSPARLRREGYFEARAVEALWHQHETGWRSWHTLLWNVLMFQAWLDATPIRGSQR